MMQILAHRGYWNTDIESNSPKALKTALENGYGFESDVRDFNGNIVISHNIATENSQNAEEVFRWLYEFNNQYCFAINIKADGLKELIQSYLMKYQISNYFLFDMSVPQMVEYRDMKLKFFTRQSEIEQNPCMYDDANGVWIDGFWSTDWITKELLEEHLENGKQICIVSPDLHGNSYYDFWEKLKAWNLNQSDVFLCTDYPDKAKEFFYGK